MIDNRHSYLVISKDGVGAKKDVTGSFFLASNYFL